MALGELMHVRRPAMLKPVYQKTRIKRRFFCLDQQVVFDLEPALDT